MVPTPLWHHWSRGPGHLTTLQRVLPLCGVGPGLDLSKDVNQNEWFSEALPARGGKSRSFPQDPVGRLCNSEDDREQNHLDVFRVFLVPYSHKPHDLWEGTWKSALLTSSPGSQNVAQVSSHWPQGCLGLASSEGPGPVSCFRGVFVVTLEGLGI